MQPVSALSVYGECLQPSLAALVAFLKQIQWRDFLRWGLKLGALGVCSTIGNVSMGFFRRWRMVSSMRDVPLANANHHPWLGFLPYLTRNKSRHHHWRHECTKGLGVSKTLGPIWDPGLLFYTITDPTCVKHIMKDAFEKYTKPDPSVDFMFHHLDRFLGHGVFTALHGVGAKDKGALWMHQRKIAASIFSKGNFSDNMEVVFSDRSKKLRDCLQSGECIDIQMLFFNFTMDASMSVFFGEGTNTSHTEPSVYGRAFDEAHRCWYEYVLHARKTMSFVGFLPWPFGGCQGLVALWHRSRSPIYKGFYANKAIMDAEHERIISKCMKDPAVNERKDMLARFVQDLDKEGFSKRRAMHYLKNILAHFVFAGRDTTACTLSWMIYVLCTHPDVQERVIAEIDSCFPPGTTPSLKTLHHNTTPVLNALVYETFRVHPSIPYGAKECKANDVLPDGSFVPKGTKLVYFPWGQNRNPDVYPDPEEFRLDRWIPFKKPADHEFPVFQAGPRICLGMSMAIFEVKMAIAVLLQEFTFTMAPEEVDKIHYSMMISMSVCNSKNQDSHNLWVTPHRRRRNGGAH